MRLLNRREQESIRNMLLDLVDAYKAGDMTLRKREWKFNLNEELMLLAKQMMLHALLLYKAEGYEATVKHINLVCDKLGELRIDKEGKINIDADEFVKMCSGGDS